MRITTRRRILQAVSIGAVGVLTGCSSTNTGSQKGTIGDEQASGSTSTPPLEEQDPVSLTAGTDRRANRFGRAVALADGAAVIGSPYTSGGPGRPKGRAYVFERAGGEWRQTASFTGNRPDAFGTSVAADGDTAVIGDYNNQVVYVIRRSDDGWRKETELAPERADTDDGYFSHSLAITGDTVYASTRPNKRAAETNTGAVYVFQRDGGEWIQQTRLTPEQTRGRGYGGFGSSIAANDGTVLIGETDRQQVHVFTWTGSEFARETILSVGDDTPDFGKTIAVSDGRALISADSHSESDEVREGVVFVYQRADDEWQRETTLSGASEREAFFGAVVATAGNLAAIGESESDTVSEDAGALYLFARTDDGWKRRAKLTREDDDGRDDEFGLSGAVSSQYLLAGACGSEANDTGKAYVYRL